MDEDEDLIMSLLLCAGGITFNYMNTAVLERRARASSRMWTQPYLLRREQGNIRSNLWDELRLEDPYRFRRCLRMNEDAYVQLLQKVDPIISKRDTWMRRSVSSDDRLTMTLRYMATGDSQESLRLYFRIGQSTISNIIKEVVDAIIEVLRGEIRLPVSVEEWIAVAEGYETKWQFPHCLGAIDGKHIRLEAPLGSGSMYYNYKAFYSIVLFAIVDADLRFIYADIGTNGRVSDSGVWNKCPLKLAIDNGQAQLPAPSPSIGGITLPYVFVTDEGLPLTQYMLTPYSKELCAGRRDRRIYNKRHGRARRTSENGFGILAARFQIFRTPIRQDPDVVSRIVLAACSLHNWLRGHETGRAMYTPAGYADEGDTLGQWRTDVTEPIPSISRQGNGRYSQSAGAIREMYMQLFTSTYPVDWQDEIE